MDINFYDGDKSKILGLMAASPEEFQTYAAALLDVPEGCVLIVQTRSVQVGKTKTERRREFLIGAVPIGQTKLIHEAGETVKPLPAPPVPRAVEIEQNVKDANDADLEVMAATNGVKVTDEWRRRSRPRREGDVAKAIAERKKEPVTA